MARYADRHVLRLSPPKLGIANKALLKKGGGKGGGGPQMVEEYLKKMVRAASLFGAGEARAQEEMGKVLEFEREMARVQEEVKDVEKVVVAAAAARN